MADKHEEADPARGGEPSLQGVQGKLARIRKLRDMIRRGEYDASGKIDAILDGIVKDLM